MGRASRAKRDRGDTGLFWHFTTTRHLPSILREARLRTTESNLSIENMHAGPDVVWLLDLAHADNAPNGLDGGATDKREVRIAVQTRAVRWIDWARSRGISDGWLNALVRAGGGWAAARHWYVCLTPIPESDWREVALRQPDGSYKSFRKEDAA